MQGELGFITPQQTQCRFRVKVSPYFQFTNSAACSVSILREELYMIPEIR